MSKYRYFDIKSVYTGEVYKVRPVLYKFYNGNTRLDLVTDTGEPYARVSVNFDTTLKEDQTFLDTNNIPNIRDFIEENGFGRFLNETRWSGFCSYPLYELDMNLLESLQ
jgi:hypothetical protein